MIGLTVSGNRRQSFWMRMRDAHLRRKRQIGAAPKSKNKNKTAKPKKSKTTSKAKTTAKEVVTPSFQDLVRKINIAKHPELKRVDSSGLRDALKTKPDTSLQIKSDLQPVVKTKAAEIAEKKKTSLVFPKIVLKVKKATAIAKDVVKAVQAVKQETGGKVDLPAVNRKLAENYQGFDKDAPGTEGGGNLLLLVGAGLAGFLIFKKLR